MDEMDWAHIFFKLGFYLFFLSYGLSKIQENK